MKTRWRQNELILMSILLLDGVLLYSMQAFRLTAEDRQMIYASAFEKVGNPYDYFWNILLPQFSQMLGPFLAYLWIQFRIVPSIEACYSNTSKIFKRKTFIWIIIQFLVIGILFFALAKITTFYGHPRIVDGDMLTLFAISDSKLIMHHLLFNSHGMGGINLGVIFIVYLIYFGWREAFLYYLNKPGYTKPYLISISNQFSAFLIVFILVSALLFIFDLEKRLTVYHGLAVSGFLVYLINLYWLFPLWSESAKINLKKVGRFFLVSFIGMIPMFFISRFLNLTGQNLFFAWLLLTLVVSPITWLIYQQRKDEILHLRGARKAIEKSKANLQFLKSQINPHFLFNALNTLYGTALMEKSERTAEGIQKLGDMMRFMLHENTKDFISLETEIDYLKNYISLQKLRTQSSPTIDIRQEIEEACLDKNIAPMLLIPFVENAFKHGISLKKKSWIHIKLTCEEGQVNFLVSNSVQAYSEEDTFASNPEKNNSGIGIQNVVNRLNLIYPGKHKLQYGMNGEQFDARLSIKI